MAVVFSLLGKRIGWSKEETTLRRPDTTGRVPNKPESKMLIWMVWRPPQNTHEALRLLMVLGAFRRKAQHPPRTLTMWLVTLRDTTVLAWQAAYHAAQQAGMPSDLDGRLILEGIDVLATMHDGTRPGLRVLKQMYSVFPLTG